MLIRQSTGLTLSLGPFVDDVDGKTAETGLSLTVYLSKNGGLAAARNSAGAISHDRDGYYRVPLDATDTGTTGALRIFASAAGALPVWRDVTVVPAAVFDAVVAGTGRLDVNAAEIAADAISAASLSAGAAAEIADAIWDEGLSSHSAAGSAGLALSSSGSAADPWATALPGAYGSGTAGWLVGQRLDAKVSSVSGSSPGAGAAEFVYTLLDAATGEPIGDADVWASTDASGSAVVASGRTDQNGRVTFYLDPGPVYLWRQKSGWNFANPDAETVA
jgi:hypothetical protein